jgi:hypothetical protein
VVADMLQANPNLTFARVKQILQQTALPFGDPLVAGAGLVDAAAAVQLAMQTATFATTANLVLRTNALDPAGLNPSLNQTLYRIYSIGSDALLAANQLGNVGSDWGFVTLGGFFDGDTADMLLRNSTSGAFQVYNVAPNSINLTGSASLGAVGLNWQFSGTGNFSSLGETDMLLRDANSGGLQVYDIKNNQITGSFFMGTVGLNWQFSGIGNFSGRGTSDMLLRDANTGGLQAYNINSNQVTGSAFIGTVGVDWQFSGVGNFSSVPGESDLLLRNVNTGGLLLYDIANNQVTGSFFLGNVGLDWQFAGVAPISAPGASDLVLRNNLGAFQVYTIAGNTLVGSAGLGAPGPDWRLRGQYSGRLHGQLGRLNLSTRASDGWFRRRCGRQLECRSPRCRNVTTDVSDSAARVRRVANFCYASGERGEARRMATPVGVMALGNAGRIQEMIAPSVTSALIRLRSFRPCRIPATNREMLARFLPRTTKPKSLRRNSPETRVR